jgi:hypothetical protein
MNIRSTFSGEPLESSDGLSIIRKLYVKPQIIHEFDLETKAGSPLGVDPLDSDLLNPFDN